MNSTLTTSFLHLKAPSFTTQKQNSTPFPVLKPIRASFEPVPNNTHKPPILQTLKSISTAAVLIGLTASFTSKLTILPAKAETSVTLTDTLHQKEAEEIEKHRNSDQNGHSPTPLSEFLESNTEAIESLKSLLQQKLDNGEDEEALKILTRLVEAQPLVTEWKFLMARLLNETGRTQDARKVFEEILQSNPLSFEALFENALLMDRCGEGDAVISRLQQALYIAENESKLKEARDVKFIIAQIQFLQKNVEEALQSYSELSKEDPTDFRPYFCRGMIYSLLDRNEEAREQFAQYRGLSPKKFEVEGYLRTPLSRMKIWGATEEN